MPDASRIQTEYFRHVLLFPEIGSTNDYLKERAWELPAGTAAVTPLQTAGRGRRGRVFLSQGALCLSVLPGELTPALRPLMPHLCGLAACDILGETARLKWPNDVQMRGKKLCGILCETVFRGMEARTVCGMGLNLSQTARWFRGHGLPEATSLLLETGSAPDFDDTAHALLTALERRLREGRRSPEALLEAYAARCDTPGQEITVLSQSGERRGTALRIAPDGGLVVRFGDTEETVRSGEVSVRPALGP